MKLKYLPRIALFTLTILLVSCGIIEDDAPLEIEKTSTEVTEKINVVATTPILGDFIDEIGDDNINLVVLMPSETDPHTYDPSPQDAAKISDADLIFYVGPKYRSN